MKNATGADVTITIDEASMDVIEDLGFGTYDETTNTITTPMNVSPKDYALRFIANTVDQTPYAFNYRLFTLTGLQWGDFNTKGQNITINKPTLTGMFKDPSFSGADWRQFIQLKGDKSNQAAFNAFLTATETLGQESA